MKPRFPLRLTVVLLVVACVLAGAGIFWFRARSAAHSSNLVSYLPAANASVVYIDVDALRRSGILSELAGAKAAEDPDYQQFVRETRFDYQHDLDAVAVALKEGRSYFALRGRFHWDTLKDYAVRQGGSCHDNFCVVPGSQPNRRISFYRLRPDVMALAVAPDDFAAYQVNNTGPQVMPTGPQDPVWAIIPAAALRGLDGVPAVAKAYVPALETAEQIVFSVGPDQERQLKLGLRVTCKDAQTATALLKQFEEVTKALRDLIAHQRQKPDAADFSTVLIAGIFRRDDQQVYGVWPIPKAFVEAITSNAY